MIDQCVRDDVDDVVMWPYVCEDNRCGEFEVSAQILIDEWKRRREKQAQEKTEKKV